MFHLTKSNAFLISGPTSCGKTYFVSKFIKNLNYLMAPPLERIVWCCSIQKKAYEQIEVNFIQGIPDFDYFDGRKTLIVIDDLMDWKNDTVTKFFTRRSHHLNLTILYLVQNLFLKSNKTIFLNSQILILFKNARDSGQISFFAGQCYPKHTKEAEKAFIDATSQPYRDSIFFSISTLKPRINFKYALVYSQRIPSLSMS